MILTNKRLAARLSSMNPKLTPANAEKFIELVGEQIGKHLATGGKVKIWGFGIFRLRIERAAFHPKITGGRQTRCIGRYWRPTKAFPIFKMGKELARSVDYKE